MNEEEAKEVLDININEHVSTFIKALIALSPSRNRVTQFLYLIYLNHRIRYDILYESFPEIMKDEDKKKLFFEIFGVKLVDEHIELDREDYGYALASFIDKVMLLFENPEFRKSASAFIEEEFPEGIPNLREEWVKVRLEGLKQVPEFSENAFKILTALKSYGRRSLETLKKLCKLDEYTLRRTLNLLEIYRLVNKIGEDYELAEDVRKYGHLIHQ